MVSFLPLLHHVGEVSEYGTSTVIKSGSSDFRGFLLTYRSFLLTPSTYQFSYLLNVLLSYQFFLLTYFSPANLFSCKIGTGRNRNSKIVQYGTFSCQFE